MFFIRLRNSSRAGWRKLWYWWEGTLVTVCVVLCECVFTCVWMVYANAGICVFLDTVQKRACTEARERPQESCSVLFTLFLWDMVSFTHTWSLWPKASAFLITPSYPQAYFLVYPQIQRRCVCMQEWIHLLASLPTGHYRKTSSPWQVSWLHFCSTFL